MMDGRKKTMLSCAARALLGAAFVLLIAPLVALGQLSNASLTGVITDASGAVIPGVEVTALQVETNTSFQAVTNSGGRYAFLNLPTGHFTITAKYKGFQTIERSGVLLSVNQAANLNLTMPPGTTTTVVNVSAQAPLINATNSTIGTQLTTKEINDLPINGRNYTQLLALTPGSTPIDVSQSAGGQLAPGGSNNPTLQGGRNRSNYYMIDGAPNIALVFNGLALVPPLDSIQEVKVETQATDTQFGGTSGGFVNLTTKAGTDHFHGSLYEYLQNNVFNSRNPYLPNVNVQPFRQNEFGFSLGGPLVLPKVYHPRANKTWFFVAYEGFRHNQSGTVLTRVPTAAERQGDFSGAWVPGGTALNAIYNPYTTAADPNNPGQYTRTQFTGNIIPTGMINPAAAAFLNEFMPLPNFNDPNKARGLNFEENIPSVYDTDSLVVRLDRNLTDRDHLSGHYMNFTGQTGSSSISVKPMSTTVQNPNRNITAEWDRTQTPTLFFNVQYSYMRSDFPIVSTTAPDYVDTWKTTSPDAFPNPPGAPPWLPVYSFTYYTTPFGQGNNEQDTTNQQLTANAQKIWGEHTLKFGFNAWFSGR